VRVASDEGVEGPVDRAHAELQQRLALKLLEPAADAVVAQLGADGQHIGPVDQPSVLDAGDAEDEADGPVPGVEGARSHAAQALADLEDSGRDALAEVGAPRLVLQGDAGGEVIVGVEMPDVQPVGRSEARGGGRRRGGLAMGHLGIRQGIQSAHPHQRPGALRCTRLCTHYSPPLTRSDLKCIGRPSPCCGSSPCVRAVCPLRPGAQLRPPPPPLPKRSPSTCNRSSIAPNTAARASASRSTIWTPRPRCSPSMATSCSSPAPRPSWSRKGPASRSSVASTGAILASIAPARPARIARCPAPSCARRAAAPTSPDASVPRARSPSRASMTPTVTAYVAIVNQATTAACDSQPEIRWASDSAGPDGSRTVTVTGRMPAGKPVWLFSYAVPQPSRFAEVVLVEALHGRGVHVAVSPLGVRHDFKALASAYTPDNL